MPLRFSASAEDWIFGFKHDSLHHPGTGRHRRWITVLPRFLGGLLALYANPMYESQLPQLLTSAAQLLADGMDADKAIRLFALVPFCRGRTMHAGLARSGGRPLVVFAPHDYDFVFFSHWFGHSEGAAKRTCGAPFQVALLMWETPPRRGSPPHRTDRRPSFA